MADDDDRTPLRLGGMALRNGLFVHGPTHWAAAVRDDRGVLRVASGRKAVARYERLIARLPVARGVVKLAEMLAILPRLKRELPEAQLAFESPSLVFTTAATTAIVAGARRSKLSPLATETIAGALSLLPALITLRSGALARYHGAEHKTIGAYESGGSAEAAPKEHDRCGSHLVGPLLGSSLLGNVLASRAPEHARNPARLAAGLASAGVAVEVFGWMTRHGSNPAARLLASPGTALQRAIGTREPSESELEVAGAALGRLLDLEG
jgi:uncharacterized protein YqhQ